ncbi:MAG: AAA family ATPase [Cyanobacteria bacterium REEB67]|nr:AAA family ATPase [Cyanobacteria bacterium REEB67]
MSIRRYFTATVFAALFLAQLQSPAHAQPHTAPTGSPAASAPVSQAPSTQIQLPPLTAPELLPAPLPTAAPALPPTAAAPTTVKTNEKKDGSNLLTWLLGAVVVLLILVALRRNDDNNSRHPRDSYGYGYGYGGQVHYDPYDQMRPRGRILSDRERRQRRDYDSEYVYIPPMSDEANERQYPDLSAVNRNTLPAQSGRSAGIGFEESMEPRYKRQSSATLILPTGKDKKTFADVAGQEETIARLREICNWLKEPDIYNRHNAELPRGVMFVGPPGTGKTLCAQALAGETHGSMFIIAASSFVEMYVGVGASRVRALFADAKAQRKQTNKPVIIFIDELDAVGGARNNGPTSNSEREQTLNQLLVEMDGFTKNEGIIVVAATNRVDMLDPALRRKGRFDLEVHVDLPDLNGREAIFKVHTRDKVVAEDVDFKLLAKRTFGMSGADLKAASNEAAIIAARRQTELEADERKAITEAQAAPASTTAPSTIGQTTAITTAMFDEAISIVESGDARRERFKAMSLADKKQTAYHELGHAVVIHKTGADTITKITILPRGRALGYVQTHTEADRWNMTDADLRKRITAAMAGRIAQEMFMQTVDTGASSDFEQANRLARKMVTEFGMSPLGPIYFPENRPLTASPTLSDRIDKEVRKIVDQCAAEARRILEDKRREIEALVSLLLEKETIFGNDFVAVFEAASQNIS